MQGTYGRRRTGTDVRICRMSDGKRDRGADKLREIEEKRII